MLNGNLVKTITADHLELQGFWVDKKSDVAVFHSHGTAGDFYTHAFIELEAQRLADAGVSLLSANNRGHDVYADIRTHGDAGVSWTQIGGAFERFEDCLLDIAAWIDFLQAHGVKRVILQAHSLTQKILYYQALKKDPRVAGQIHLSPCNDAGYMLHVLGEEKYKQVNMDIAQKMQEGKGKELLPAELAVVCPMGVQAYAGYLTEESTGNLFPYHVPGSNKWGMLESTTDPLLAIFGGSDGFIKPSIDTAAQLFRNKARSAKNIQVEIVSKAPHSYVGFEDALVTHAVDWVKKCIT